ncbi:MAG: hemerythrin domain-containing protein [Tissierellales bacterium]
MNTIDILVNEHDNIQKMLKVVRIICVGILDGKEIPHDDMVSIIDFIRNYADKHHHGKEEDMLFRDMTKELEAKIGPGPVQGMLIEHDFGRGYVKDLETALIAFRDGNADVKVDIIANAIGYANLLERHIFKENNMLFKYVEKNLSEETMNKLDREFKEYESNSEHIETKEKYIRLAEELEKKYM